MALSFQAAPSGLKIVTVTYAEGQGPQGARERDYICVGDTTAIFTDDQGRMGIGNLGTGQGPPCPLGAHSAAVVTVYSEFWLKAALYVIAGTTLAQILLLRE